MAENNAEFIIHGIDSTADIRKIEDELDELDGVMGMQIDESGEASTKYDVDILAEERIKITVREMGYNVV